MRAYKDPTADIAIKNVAQEEKKLKKHSGIARYYQPKERSGKSVHVNKAEWFYSRFRKALREVENGAED